MTSTNDAVGVASYSFNNLIFVQNPVTGDGQLGTVVYEASAAGQRNALAQSVVVGRQSPSDDSVGLRRAVRDAFVARKPFSVLALGRCIVDLVPELRRALKVSTPATFHAAASRAESIGDSVGDAARALLITDQTDAMAAYDIGIPVFSSHSGVESYCVALAAERLARSARCSVVHVFNGAADDGSRIATLPSDVVARLIPLPDHYTDELIDLERLYSPVETCLSTPPVSEKSARDALTTVVNAVAAQSTTTTMNRYEIVQYFGPKDAAVVFVLFGATASDAALQVCVLEISRAKNTFEFSIMFVFSFLSVETVYLALRTYSCIIYTRTR